MSSQGYYTTSSGSYGYNRPRTSSYTSPNGYLTTPVQMVRGNSMMSNASANSNYTDYSYGSDNGLSPSTAWSTANSPGGYMDEGSKPRSFSFSAQAIASSSQSQQNASATETDELIDSLPPFDPRQGDPQIHGMMYYDFVVEKNETYWQLKQGYQPSEEYPERRKDQVVHDPKSGKRVFPCRHPECTSTKPFSRCWDLRRHFKTHDKKKSSRSSSKTTSASKSKDDESMLCDYLVCPSHRNKNPFDRRDHGREHYREVHSEDLVKRSPQDPQVLSAWLKNRQMNLKWWRCSKCLHRIKIRKYGWVCSDCNITCESERVEEREARYGPYDDSGSTRGIAIPKTSGSSSSRRRDINYDSYTTTRSAQPQQDYQLSNLEDAEYDDDDDDEYEAYNEYPEEISELPDTNGQYDETVTSWGGPYGNGFVASPMPARESFGGSGGYPASNGSQAWSGGSNSGRPQYGYGSSYPTNR